MKACCYDCENRKIRYRTVYCQLNPGSQLSKINVMEFSCGVLRNEIDDIFDPFDCQFFILRENNTFFSGNS